VLSGRRGGLPALLRHRSVTCLLGRRRARDRRRDSEGLREPRRGGRFRDGQPGLRAARDSNP
jgi:hypothetical protein